MILRRFSSRRTDLVFDKIFRAIRRRRRCLFRRFRRRRRRRRRRRGVGGMAEPLNLHFCSVSFVSGGKRCC